MLLYDNDFCYSCDLRKKKEKRKKKKEEKEKEKKKERNIEGKDEN